VRSRNKCWESVSEEKQAGSSESGGWGMDNRKSIPPLIGRSWELTLAELSLNGYAWSCFPPIATELTANLLQPCHGPSSGCVGFVGSLPQMMASLLPGRSQQIQPARTHGQQSWVPQTILDRLTSTPDSLGISCAAPLHSPGRRCNTSIELGSCRMTTFDHPYLSPEPTLSGYLQPTVYYTSHEMR
jgi:hypothetical protein